MQHLTQAGDHPDGMSAEVVQKYPHLPEMDALSRQSSLTSRIVLNAEQAWQLSEFDGTRASCAAHHGQLMVPEASEQQSLEPQSCAVSFLHVLRSLSKKDVHC